MLCEPPGEPEHSAHAGQTAQEDSDTAIMARAHAYLPPRRRQCTPGPGSPTTEVTSAADINSGAACRFLSSSAVAVNSGVTIKSGVTSANDPSAAPASLQGKQPGPRPLPGIKLRSLQGRRSCRGA